MSALAVTLTVDELEQLVERAVTRAVGQRPDSDVLTRDEVAQLLQIHPRVVVTYVRTRGMPGKQVGRSWRFRRSEVLAWLEEQAVRPGAPTSKYAEKIARVR
jgi:excisionase family DNA binding protein